MIKLKPILTEGRYDKVVSDMTKDIISDIKDMLKSNKKKIDSWDQYLVLGKIFTVEAEINAISKWTYSMESKSIIKDDEWMYNIDGVGGEGGMELEIQLQPAAFPSTWNEFIGELKDTIRHEVEHFSQFYLKGKPKQIKRFPKTGIPFYEYLLLPHEVPAFWHGFLAKSKRKKITIDKAMDEYLNMHKKTLGGKYNEVRDKWLEYGKKNFPDAKWGI